MPSAAAERSRFVALIQAALPYLIIAGVLFLWEVLVRLNGIQPIYLPAPSSILRYLLAMLLDGSLIYHLSITFMRIMAGFLVAAASGILVGVAMGMSPLAARIVDPWIAEGYQAASGSGQAGCRVTAPSAGRGFGFGRGAGAPQTNRSAGRFPDGADTDSNCTDFLVQAATAVVKSGRGFHTA